MQHTVISSGIFYKGVTHDLQSPVQSPKLTYSIGSVVKADHLDTDPNVKCGKGINFCRTMAEALPFGPVVLLVTLPAGSTIIDAGGKLRASSVMVEARVNLADANLAGAYLAGVNLAGVNLARVNLAGANLTDANLAGAYLAGANLTDANLARAYLTGVNLARAYLTGANLAGVNLAGANLAGVNLTGAYLTGARGDGRTILPWGWVVSDAGLVVRS